MIVRHVRLWKSLTNDLKDIEINIDKKYQNYTHVKVNAEPLKVKEEDNQRILEDCNIADNDIIIVES